MVGLGKAETVESAEGDEAANENGVIFPGDGFEGERSDLTKPDGSDTLAKSCDGGTIAAKMLGESFGGNSVKS